MNKSTPPTISVVILTNNRPHLLKKALTSINNQTIKPIEVITVNDSSTLLKQSVSVIRNNTTTVPLIKRNSKHSISYGRSIGMKAARGDIVVYLDDDCEASSTYLRKFRDHFSKNPKITAVIGRIINALPDNVYASTQYAYYDRGLRRFFPTLDRIKPLTWGRILDCEVMGIRRNKLNAFGFPDRDRLYRNDDVELGLRLIQAKEYIIFDPSITAHASPRTSLKPLWTAAFWNGYSDACTENLYNINLRLAPYQSFFPTWCIKEIQSKHTFSIWKKIGYFFLLLSFPTVSRIGKVWYYTKTTYERSTRI